MFFALMVAGTHTNCKMAIYIVFLFACWADQEKQIFKTATFLSQVIIIRVVQEK